MIVIVRSCSGAGKSTLAIKLADELHTSFVEADTFHYEGNEYVFKPERVSDAHLWCQLQADRILRLSGSVVISNTFTTVKEMLPYWLMASKYNVPVKIVEPNTPWKKDIDVLVEKNIHKVPRQVLEQQLSRWVDIPEGIYDPKNLIDKYCYNS